jgi:hypothetical protein
LSLQIGVEIRESGWFSLVSVEFESSTAKESRLTRDDDEASKPDEWLTFAGGFSKLKT